MFVPDIKANPFLNSELWSGFAKQKKFKPKNVENQEDKLKSFSFFFKLLQSMRATEKDLKNKMYRTSKKYLTSG